MLEVFWLCLLWAVLALGKGFPSFLFFFPNLKHRSLEDPLLSICITTGGKNLRHKTFLGRRINRLCQFKQAMEFRTIISVMLLVKWVQYEETHNQNVCDRPRKIFKGVSFANNVDVFQEGGIQLASACLWGCRSTSLVPWDLLAIAVCPLQYETHLQWVACLHPSPTEELFSNKGLQCSIRTWSCSPPFT